LNIPFLKNAFWPYVGYNEQSREKAFLKHNRTV
jgi:hypothetical protein